ncbi:hypothetical protein KDL01_40720 [Actinospica durhamensis]|uniref:Uncharacterized protein n=1 Tax=Actinospica durhamensis TaxID=1508375 RepID=A0A941EYS1_9ACTN|nr:hypothetical protein [Actinospica durhamensis]MBR7839646.1 hypothetical protein [Actinospica durhamensis]
MAAPGDQATATIWNNAVVSIADYGISGTTTDTPGEYIPVPERIITAAAICAALFTRFALFAWTIDRSTSGRFRS